MNIYLIGGFNPSEKYARQMEIFPNFRGENKKYLKPPPRSPIQKLSSLIFHQLVLPCYECWILGVFHWRNLILPQKNPRSEFRFAGNFRLRRYKFTTISHEKNGTPSPLAGICWSLGIPFTLPNFWWPKPDPKKKQKRRLHVSGDVRAPAGCCAPHPEAPHKLLASVPRHFGQSSSPAILWKFQSWKFGHQ